VKAEDYTPLPPPQADDTFGTTKVRRKAISDGRSKRQHKGLQQFNVKIRARSKSRFQSLYEAAQSKTPVLTRGDFFDLMLSAYEASATDRDLSKVVDSLLREAVPSAVDREAGRTVPLPIFASTDLAMAIKGRAKAKQWTLSATFEHVCAVAYEAQSTPATTAPKRKRSKRRSTG